MNKKMNILVLVKPKVQKLWMKNHGEFNKYFEMEDVVDEPKNITKYLNKPIDILFIDDPKYWENEFYKTWQEKNKSFQYVVFQKEPDPSNDISILKNLADRIIYTNISQKLLYWEIMSTLRRYWNAYSKPSTIIYRGIIADFIESKFTVNKEEVSLTPKEIAILRMLISNPKRYLDKKEIFKKVWGYDEDNTRTLDQTLFKLRRKVGKEYFVVTKNKGVKID